MELNENLIIGSAYTFAYFLAITLMKYVLYDNGFAFSNILLILGLVYIRLYFLAEESYRFQECASLAIFALFDKDLLDIGNVFLLLGVGCVREQLNHNFNLKEAVSLSCGLIFLLMGWFSVGKVLIVYSLILFFYHTNSKIIKATSVLEIIVYVFECISNLNILKF